MFFGLIEKFFGVRYSWIALCSLSCQFLCPLLDGACGVALHCMLTKNHYSKRRTADREQVATSTMLSLRQLSALQCVLQQFLVSWHQWLTTPIACSACRSQTTTTHHIESLIAPFFSPHIYLSRHCCIFLIHVALQPQLWNTRDPGNSCQGKAFQQ